MENIPDRASNVVRIHPEYTVTEESPLPLAQMNLFTGEAEPVPIEVSGPVEEGRERVLEEGISMVQTQDGSQIVLSGFGIFLSKKSERLIVRSGKKSIYESPLFRVNEVVVAYGSSTIPDEEGTERRQTARPAPGVRGFPHACGGEPTT